jgi:hypothetical protein
MIKIKSMLLNLNIAGYMRKPTDRDKSDYFFQSYPIIGILLNIA